MTKKVIKFDTRSYVDQETGEVIEVQQIARSGDSDFHKIWLSHILDAVDEVGNKKMKILMYLMSNIDYQNRYVGTYQMIADEVGCHKKTVGELMKTLLEQNIISRPQQGVVRVSPDIIFKGSKQKRMNVLLKYGEESDQVDMFKDYKKTAVEQQAKENKAPH